MASCRISHVGPPARRVGAWPNAWRVPTKQPCPCSVGQRLLIAAEIAHSQLSFWGHVSAVKKQSRNKLLKPPLSFISWLHVLQCWRNQEQRYQPWTSIKSAVDFDLGWRQHVSIETHVKICAGVIQYTDITNGYQYSAILIVSITTQACVLILYSVQFWKRIPYSIVILLIKWLVQRGSNPLKKKALLRYVSPLFGHLGNTP